MNEYVPTTDDLRKAWVEHTWAYGGTVIAKREFDRWLAQVKADAWDEGYRAGWSDGGDANVAGLDPDDEHHNPYRS